MSNRLADLDKDRIRCDKARMEEELRAAGCIHKSGNSWCCGWHEDKNPSSGIWQGEHGEWLFTCQRCQITLDIFEVMARNQKKTSGEVMKELAGGNGNGHVNGNGKHKPTGGKPPPMIYASIEDIRATYLNVEDVYPYTKPNSKEVELYVIRWIKPDGDKSFCQVTPREGGWAKQGVDGQNPLFNRTRLLRCDCPVIVEGEKKVKALAKLGIVATTSPGGSGSANNADWTPINAKKEVIIWRDNDENGLKYQEAVIAILTALPAPPDIRIVNIDPLELPPKGDVVDFIKIYMEGQDEEEARRAVEAVLASTIPAGPSDELLQRFEDIISGKYSAIDFHWANVTRLTQALLPGKVTVLCGAPESGKSFWLLESMWRWHMSGMKVALYELEDDRTAHLQRVNSQMAKESRLTEAKWIKENPDQVRQLHSDYHDQMQSFGKCLYIPSSPLVKMTDLSKWVEERCKEGKDIIAIDPITAAQGVNKPWIDDNEFLIKAKAAAHHYGARIIIVTHPRIGKDVKPDLSSLAGGAAYPRFCHTVLWMQKHAPKTVKATSTFGNSHVRIDRTLRICKARNARGGGSDIGYSFDPVSLCFAEQGVIIEEEEHEER